MSDPFHKHVQSLIPHLHKETPMAVKFNKAVDSGPLPEDADEATRETIQQERIRRQVASHAYPEM